MHNSIRRRLILVFIGLATGPLLIVGAILAWRSFTVLQQQSLLLQQEAAKRVNVQIAAFFQELEGELRFAIQTQDLERLDQDSTSALSDLLAYQPAFHELHLLDNKGRERAGVSRTNVVSTAVDRSHADEFTIPKTTGQVYYGTPFYDQTANEPLMTIAVPIINARSGSVDGVFVAIVRIKKVWDIIAGIKVSPGQSIYMVAADGKVAAHRNPSVVLRDTKFNVPKQNGVQSGLNGDRVVLAFDTMSLGQQQFSIVAEQTLAEALAPAFNIVFVTLVLIIVVAGIAITVGLWNVRRIIQPIQTLVKTAEKISTGDLTAQAQITSNDEIGTLATTFNLMTSRLRELVGNLEARVADRTKALLTASEVSGRISRSIHVDRQRLINEVVELVNSSFNFYHTQIYFIHPPEEDLVLEAATGEAGQMMIQKGHRISKGKGLVGRAAETNAPVLVSDVSERPDWLPNSLLPETKSELAVPISSGETVIGVLDVQHNIAGGLTREHEGVLQIITNQIMIAAQNARFLMEAQKRAEREESITAINQKIQSTTTMESALQVAVREVGRILGAQASVQLVQTDQRTDTK